MKVGKKKERKRKRRGNSRSRGVCIRGHLSPRKRQDGTARARMPLLFVAQVGLNFADTILLALGTVGSAGYTGMGFWKERKVGKIRLVVYIFCWFSGGKGSFGRGL